MKRMGENDFENDYHETHTVQKHSCKCSLLQGDSRKLGVLPFPSYTPSRPGVGHLRPAGHMRAA